LLLKSHFAQLGGQLAQVYALSSLQQVTLPGLESFKLKTKPIRHLAFVVLVPRPNRVPCKRVQRTEGLCQKPLDVDVAGSGLLDFGHFYLEHIATPFLKKS